MLRHPSISFLILLLLVLSPFAKAQGVDYFKGDVYDALLKAKNQGKVLLVECYAGWNNKSRWMNEMINSDDRVLEFLAENFIVWQIDTRTKGGAKFAVDYKVNDYPSLFVFNRSGSVIDKIDKAMEADDFIRTLEEDLFTLKGGNLWKLEQLEKAAQSGDREKTDAVFSEYLSKIGREEILNKSHRWVFDDPAITFYGSTAFFFMIDNRRELSSTPQDSIEVDGYIFSALYARMKEMLLDHNECDTVRLKEVSYLAEELLPKNHLLPLFPPAIVAFAKADYDSYLHHIDMLIESVPDEEGPTLAYTLSVITENGTVSQKTYAKSIVHRLMNSAKDPSVSASLQLLYEKL